METLEIGMSEGLFGGNTFGWFSLKHLGQEVHEVGVGILDLSVKWGLHQDLGTFMQSGAYSRFAGKGFEVLLSVGIGNECHIIRFAHSINDQFNLLDVVLAREEHFATNKLGNGATKTPNINGFTVLNSPKN